MATLNKKRAKIPLYRKRWVNLSPKQKLLREKSLSVLSDARKSNQSLSKLAKKHNVSRKTVLNNTNAFRKKQRHWNSKRFDKVPRVMKINENRKEVSIQINDSRTASLIGRYQNTVKQFLNTGNKKVLRRFHKKKIKDIDGNAHSFETNPESLIEINQRIEEPEFYEVYTI